MDDCLIKCENCAHYKQESATCHRYPPVSVLMEEGPYWAFPEVDPEDHCGEFQGKS